VVTGIENTIEHKDIALGAFLDIEGAFDRTSFDTIKQAAERHGIEPAVCRWICAMLESRKIILHCNERTWVLLWPRGVCRQVCCHLCCGAWLWTIFGDLTIMATIQ
jgi:hypothetical protein